MALTKQDIASLVEATIEEVKEFNAGLGICGEDIPKMSRKDFERFQEAIESSPNKENKTYFFWTFRYIPKIVEYFLVGTNANALWRSWTEFYKFSLNGENRATCLEDRCTIDFLIYLKETTESFKFYLEEKYNVPLKYDPALLELIEETTAKGRA